MRIGCKRPPLLNSFPFSGEGVSLYVTAGTRVQYRHFRAACGSFIKGQGDTFEPGAASVLKTARRTSVAAPAEEIAWTLPADLASQTLVFDVRTYRDNVENESENFHPVTIEVDGNLDPVTEIEGTATLLAQEQRDGGVVRLRLIYHPSLTGVQPNQFVAIRTAGPTSPADATTDYYGQQIVEIDTPALSDASNYTYKIQAKNGSVTKDVLTGITVTADATGPSAPTGSAQDW